MRRYFKPLFSKKILTVLFVLLQIALLVMPVLRVYSNYMYLGFLMNIVAAGLVVFEINRESDAGFKLIWIAIIAFFPVFGTFLYVYVQSDMIMRLFKKRVNDLNAESLRIADGMGLTENYIAETLPDEAGILRYLRSQASAPCFEIENIEYFPLGEDMYSRLIRDVSKAEKYVFLEFFIVNEFDSMWSELLKILCQKAEDGVEIRMIYDAMGSLTTTKANLDERLRKMGINCYQFSPVKPFISTYHNNRDHRKIVVIDGEIAYTGGVNLADEYVNRKVRFGHWKDTAIRVEGARVKRFLAMYLKIWRLVCPHEDSEVYRNKAESYYQGKDGYIVPFDDTPVDTKYITRDVYLHILSSAKDYVYINTPYLILDDALLQAMKFAAARGVKVKICMPHIPDKWYAFMLARSYYPELLRAGVEIYEYKQGFLHAKSTVSDGRRGYVGSANYDYRSLYLHYECGAYLCESSVIETIKDDFEKTIEAGINFTIDKYSELNWFYRVSGRVLRLFSSVM